MIFLDEEEMCDRFQALRFVESGIRICGWLAAMMAMFGFLLFFQVIGM